MATVYKKTNTRRRSDGSKNTQKTSTYYGKVRDPITGQFRVIALKTTDKAAAKTNLNAAQRRIALEAAGLVNPHEEHLGRLLLEHVDDFEKSLHARGNTRHHALTTANRVREIVKALPLSSNRKQPIWQDLTGDVIETYLATRRGKGLANKTSNHYLQAAKGFAEWMVMSKRSPDNPLKYLRPVNAEVDRRRTRRTLLDAEIGTLLKHTQSGPVRHSMTGKDRSMLYRLALETGFRAKEILSLSRQSFDLDSDPPTITVEAACSEHRQEDVQPIRRSFAEQSCEWLRTAPQTGPVFRVGHKNSVGMMLKEDLEAAGIARCNERGLVDMHGLRHTYITRFADNNVHPSVAKQLARLSTIAMTMDVYTHSYMPSQQAALESLPEFPDDDPAETRAVATGTDDAEPRFGDEYVAPYVRQTGVRSCPLKASTDTPDPIMTDRKKGTLGGTLSPSDTTCHCKSSLDRPTTNTGVDGNRTHQAAGEPPPQRL